MTLPVSPNSISLSQVNVELARSATAMISMNEAAVRGLFGVASGAIGMSSGRGKSSQFVFSFAGGTNVDLRTAAINAGWNQTSKVIATNTGVITSTSTGAYALTVSGSFPNGVQLNNSGFIVGMGGAGGNIMAVGNPGGPAIGAFTAVTINNTGTIAGGGGGGGAGAYWAWNGLNRSTPGSGGASSTLAAAGGGGGPNTQGAPSVDATGDGIFETPGASQNWGWGGRASSPGGKGGTWGQPGDAGGTVDGAYNYTGYAGGAAGAAVAASAPVNWIATGTIYGVIPIYGALQGNQFVIQIPVNQTNVSLRDMAINLGWNQSTKVVATISPGIYISSNSTGTAALTVSGSFPAGVEVVNNGFIIGMGGAGGNGHTYSGGGGTNGSAGGTAFLAQTPLTFTNSGTIAGGGGGGAGGGSGSTTDKSGTIIVNGGGGGGGRSSAAANSAGGGGTFPGSIGTLGAPGAGGSNGGGSGGAWGTAGSNGSNLAQTPNRSPTAAGAGGAAVSGNANITWVATGTRLGAIG
jgi:hypothetical protein